MNVSRANAEEKRWRAEADLSTLIEAEKIKRDKDRLKAAMKMRRERITELDKLEA